MGYTASCSSSTSYEHVSLVLVMQWGAVERKPRRYDWSGYRQLFNLIKALGLKIQVCCGWQDEYMVGQVRVACSMQKRRFRRLQRKRHIVVLRVEGKRV